MSFLLVGHASRRLVVGGGALAGQCADTGYMSAGFAVSRPLHVGERAGSFRLVGFPHDRPYP
jgi:hypothetical protein